MGLCARFWTEQILNISVIGENSTMDNISLDSLFLLCIYEYNWHSNYVPGFQRQKCTFWVFHFELKRNTELILKHLFQFKIYGKYRNLKWLVKSLSTVFVITNMEC